MSSQDSPSPGKLRLAEATSAAAPAVWDWDVETQTFLTSDRVHQIYGFPVRQPLTLAKFLAATHSHDSGWAEGLVAGNREFPAEGVRYRIKRADTGDVRWLRARVHSTSRQGSKKIISYTGTLEDITEQMRATHALMESETRLRLAIEAGKMAVWEVDLEAGTVTNTPELNLLFGLRPDAKPTFQELRALYAPGELARLEKEGATLEVVRRRYAKGELRPRQEAASAAGEDRTQVQADLTIITPSGVKKRLLYRAQYAFSLEGRPQITGLLVDITDRKLAEERLALVASELQHRVKNSLGVVQALAVQTLRTPADAEAAITTFLSRLKALATATDIILDSGSSAAEVSDIVTGITRPYRLNAVDPFVINGPDVRVPGKAATALGMIFHELCTNAVKYGALSSPSGRVHLNWSRSADNRLTVDWEERGGPPVQASATPGFGARLLRTLVPADLSGSLDLRFGSSGVRCRITTGQILSDS